MKFDVLYEAAMLESLNQNDEIKDTLNILFLMNINSGNTVIPMAKVKGFIKQKFDLSIDTDTLKKLLADMDSVTDFTDDEVNLASEDDGSETSKDADKEAVADMSAKAGAEEMEDLDTAGLSEALDIKPDSMSNDTADRDMMFELFSRIVCAKELAHLLHLNSDSAGEHLMLEKIYEMLDGMIDEFGEVYFMSRNIKIPNPLLDAKDFAEGDLGLKLQEMLDLAQTICSDNAVDDGTKSLVSDCMKGFQRCLGFWRQAENDAEPSQVVDLDNDYDDSIDALDSEITA